MFLFVVCLLFVPKRGLICLFEFWWGYKQRGGKGEERGGEENLPFSWDMIRGWFRESLESARVGWLSQRTTRSFEFCLDETKACWTSE